MDDGVYSEALSKHCLSEASQTTYSGTLNIAPYRKINGVMYREYTECGQKQVMLNALYEIVGTVHLEQKGIYHIWEKTEKGNIHLHCRIVGWELESMITLQNKLHEKFSYKNIEPKRTFYFERTTTDIKYWLVYMQKYQDTE